MKEVGKQTHDTVDERGHAEETSGVFEALGLLGLFSRAHGISNRLVRMLVHDRRELEPAHDISA